MRIKFSEDVRLCVGHGLNCTKKTSRKLSKGDTADVEFLGEDNDLTTIDFEFLNGLVAQDVPRHVVEILCNSS
jgi:hypothetical protein